MKEVAKVFLLLNGEAPKSFPDLSGYDVICATDGSCDTLLAHQIEPNIVCGDFDSISNLPTKAAVLETPNQDFTDFEKCLDVLFDKGFIAIDVYGASGKEQDHFLGNLHSALVWKDRLELTFFDDYGSYRFIPNDYEVRNIKDKTVSLVPFPKASGVVTKGLEFPLTNEDLEMGTRIGIRNKAISNQIAVRFTTGNLILFISH